MELRLEKGRPLDETGRLEKEIRTYDLLDSLGIEYERADHEEASTMEACAAVDAVLAPAVICKNLFLCNTQKTKFYLLMIKNDKKFKTKEISKQINSSRLSFAPPEYMEKFLDITPGSASVMGLMNDKDHAVRLLIDADLLSADEIGVHPCFNTASLAIATTDILEKFLPTTGHSYTKVTLVGE